jgi:hypothetical protein
MLRFCAITSAALGNALASLDVIGGVGSEDALAFALAL